MKKYKNYYGHRRFYELLDKMAEIHSKKNRDYGKLEDPLANFKMSRELGISPFLGCLIRISDKYSRIAGFAKKGFMEVKEESIQDTLIDLSVYAIIATILYEEEYKK